MDVIINNPPAQAAPQVTVAPSTFQGYGYAPNPNGFGPNPSRDHDGGGFGAVLILLFGGFLLARARRRHGRPALVTGHGAAPISATSWVKSSLFGDSALDIARARLARGEITPEEYEAIHKSLTAE